MGLIYFTTYLTLNLTRLKAPLRKQLYHPQTSRGHRSSAWVLTLAGGLGPKREISLWQWWTTHWPVLRMLVFLVQGASLPGCLQLRSCPRAHHFLARMVYWCLILFFLFSCHAVCAVLCVVSSSEKKVKSLSCVQLFATPWTVDHQAPLSMGFSRQEYRSGLPFHFPGDLPDPGIEPASPALAGSQILYH